jgi:hypothetical protein
MMGSVWLELGNVKDPVFCVSLITHKFTTIQETTDGKMMERELSSH